MIAISNPIATQRAHLVWQPRRESSAGGSADLFAVAELEQMRGGDGVSFRYLDDDALEAPRRLGFRSYAGLPFDARPSDNDRNAVTLLRLRLPPSSRSDFGEMLMRFGLPPDWDHTDLSLLAYTGGRSVHDDFSVCETFDGFDAPFDYVFDLVGVGHCRSACEELSPGDALEFERDLKTDHDAVKVVRPGAPDGEATVGYVNCIQAKTVCKWLDDGMIRSRALRFNSRPDCPRLFVHAEVFPPRASC